MTTNETAQAVRDGRADVVELWQAVRRFAMRTANRWYRAFDGRCGVERSDLMQSAFIALVNALEHWDSTRAGFLTMFEFSLKKEFAQLYGLRGKADPINDSISTATPLGSEDEDLTLEDVLPDPAAGAAFGEWERRQAVADALATLPPEQQRAIILEFWGDQQADSKTRNAALKNLRRPAISGKLKNYL